jgi:hypothetical protein
MPLLMLLLLMLPLLLLLVLLLLHHGRLLVQLLHVAAPAAPHARGPASRGGGGHRSQATREVEAGVRAPGALLLRGRRFAAGGSRVAAVAPPAAVPRGILHRETRVDRAASAEIAGAAA